MLPKRKTKTSYFPLAADSSVVNKAMMLNDAGHDKNITILAESITLDYYHVMFLT
jgi:hypothetical protein